MSFILDALKKSETERQQRSSPGIADVPIAPARQRKASWVAPAVILLLAVNLGVLVYVLMRPAASPTDAAPAAEPLRSTSPDTAPRVTRPAAPAAETRTPAARPQPRTDEAESPAPTSVASNESTPAVETPFPETRSGTQPAATQPAPVTVADEPVAAQPTYAEETWLTFNDLRASGQLDLPELHIDLHVYSDNPAERFVFINMNQYRENGTISEGPRVRRITPEGVLLEYRGSTFLLPRD